ncbi:MAG: hypothetical protein IJY07_02255 [Clostridia bacterium]|nr:hypothetical protein [Clostridia bacterium]
MSFFNEVAIYFRGMSWLVALLMVLGFVLILIELFQNGFGIFGVIGAVVIALGIVLRVSVGDGVIFAQIFISVFIESIAVLIAFLVLLKTGKAGWLRRSPIVESTESHTENEQIGEYGTALTDIAPIGVANIEGEVKDVVTESFNIAQGENLKVSHTENDGDNNNKIVVEKID